MTLWILLVGVHVGALVWWLAHYRMAYGWFWGLPIEEQASICTELGIGGALWKSLDIDNEILRQKQESLKTAYHTTGRAYNLPSYVQCAMQIERQRQEQELAMLGRSSYSRNRDQALRNIQPKGPVTDALGSLAPFLRGKPPYFF